MSKKPTIITTDLKRMAEIYAKPSTQTNAEAVRTILRQNSNP